MAISTLDQAMAGMQDEWHWQKFNPNAGLANQWRSFWYTAGIPAAGVANTTQVGGIARSSSNGLVVGQIPHYDPSAGQSAYLAKFLVSAMAAGAGSWVLCDRLWDCGANTNGAFKSTVITTQSVNSVSWPARDINGTANGAGVYVGLEVSSLQGAGSPTFNVTYVNSAGQTGQTGINAQPYITASTAGAFYPFTMTNGDFGVQNVTSIIANATQTSGQWNLVAYRILTTLDLVTNPSVGSVDISSGGFTQILNGAVLFPLWFCGVAGSMQTPFIAYRETQG